MSIYPTVSEYYQEQPLSVRLHVLGRWKLFAFPALAQYLPRGDVFVDLGCGYGVWALYLSQLCPQARILCSDPDEEKICALTAVIRNNGMTNLELSLGKAEDIPIPTCDMVSLIDILYLIPYDHQIEILQKCAVSLQTGGRIMIKEIGSRPRWKFWVNYLEEIIAVRVLRITHGHAFYFRTEDEWKGVLEGLAMNARVIRLDTGYLHPHILILGEKN